MTRFVELFDEKPARVGGPPPDPLQMGVRPPREVGFVDAAAIKRKIRATRKKVNRLLKKYEEG